MLGAAASQILTCGSVLQVILKVRPEERSLKGGGERKLGSGNLGLFGPLLGFPGPYLPLRQGGRPRSSCQGPYKAPKGPYKALALKGP